MVAMKQRYGHLINVSWLDIDTNNDYTAVFVLLQHAKLPSDLAFHTDKCVLIPIMF